MKSQSLMTLTLMLVALAFAGHLSAGDANLLQSFDDLFIGDDASESFEFTRAFNANTPTTLRFAGFLENRNVDADGGVRFYLGWQGTNTNAIESILFPAWPDYLHGVSLPRAHEISRPVRVPVEFQAEIPFSPGWIKLAVEGLTGDDNFRFAGEFILRSEPQLRISTLGVAGAQFTWTTNSVGFRLEWASSLSTPVWNTVTNDVTMSNGTCSVSVEATNAMRIYRLRKL